MWGLASQDRKWLSEVYATVHEACADTGALPPGTIGKLARIVDDARSVAPADEFVARADDMLVVLHRLRSALARNGLQTDPVEIRAKLKAMSRDWIKKAPLW